MEAITDTLRSLEIGQPQQFRNLTAFPLLHRDADSPAYITLSRAIQNKTAKITELSEGGSIPELLLNNTGEENILILDGEELIGAKQNRITNLTILAAANSKTVLPVSCVEAGRWGYRSAEFKVSSRTMFQRGRATKAAALSENLKATGTYGADQSMVWDDISDKQERMSVHSETDAMADMYDQHHDQVEEYAQSFTTVTNQVGVLFAIDGEVEGMDLFDAPQTMEAMLPKLTRGFAIDALETEGQTAKAAELQTVSRFLDRIAAAHADSYPGVGLGTDIRLSGPLVAGGALVYEDHLVHLAAFGRQGPQSPGIRSSDETRLRARRYDQMRRRDQDH